MDGAEVKSPQGSLLSTAGTELGAPLGRSSRPPSKSNKSFEGADTGLITELGAGRAVGIDAAPGGGGKRSGPAPSPVFTADLSFLAFLSMLRLTRMV